MLDYPVFSEPDITWTRCTPGQTRHWRGISWIGHYLSRTHR